MAKFAELERIKVAGKQAQAAQTVAAAGDAPVSGAPVAADAGACAGAAGQDTQQQQQQQQQDMQQHGAAAAAAAEPPGGTTTAAGGAEAGGGEGQGGLTDEQLLEVFKQTSMFNVRTALQDNEMLLGIDEILEATNERCVYVGVGGAGNRG